MQVSLKVIGGKNDGRMITISVPTFIIGRSEEAHLRPSSDLISRQHCAIKIEGGRVTVEDLGSRNGTYINEQQLSSPHVVKIGDVLRVGRLQFEMNIDHVQPGIKKPKVNLVSEAAARTASAPNEENFDESITDWLSQAPENQDQSTAMFDTRQFNLDETKYRIDTEQNSPIAKVARPSDSQPIEEGKTEVSSGIFGMGKKKNVKKLPPRQRENTESTTDAAGDVLRRFFNQR
jgi:predicted component of type VI protein secretion system